MKTVTKKKLYEAMFLVDSADAGSDWDGVIAAITKILKRGKVDVVSIKKWDDRRLAYEIRRKTRGTYILCYFRADGHSNQEIEKAVQISEKIIRVLILCVDWMTDEDIAKDTPATREEKERQEREEAKAEAKKDEKETEDSTESEPAEEDVRAENVEATEPTASKKPPDLTGEGGEEEADEPEEIGAEDLD